MGDGADWMEEGCTLPNAYNAPDASGVRRGATHAVGESRYEMLLHLYDSNAGAAELDVFVVEMADTRRGVEVLPDELT